MKKLIPILAVAGIAVGCSMLTLVWRTKPSLTTKAVPKAVTLQGYVKILLMESHGTMPNWVTTIDGSKKAVVVYALNHGMVIVQGASCEGERMVVNGREMLYLVCVETEPDNDAHVPYRDHLRRFETVEEAVDEMWKLNSRLLADGATILEAGMRPN